MKIAFYRAFQPSAEFIDRFIARGTFSEHSHTENIFSDGISYSISARDGASRFKKIDYHPDHWDIIEINVTPEEELTIRRKAMDRVGIKYDWFGAFFSFLRWFKVTRWLFKECIQSERRIFCSEETVNLLRTSTKAYAHLEDGCEYPPGRVFDELCTPLAKEKLKDHKEFRILVD